MPFILKIKPILLLIKIYYNLYFFWDLLYNGTGDFMKLYRDEHRYHKVILFDRSIKFVPIITSCGKILVSVAFITTLLVPHINNTNETIVIAEQPKNHENTVVEENEPQGIKPVVIIEKPVVEEIEPQGIKPVVIIEEPIVEEKPEQEISIEQQLIEEFSHAYNINSEIAYKIAKEKTNNFTDPEYLKTNNIKGTTFGGVEKTYQTKEQGLLLFIRNLAQIPSTFGVTKEEITNNSNYSSAETYENMTKRYSEIMGMDPALNLAIMYNESAIFKSDMFLYMNNPGGLKNGDYFWNFNTKEEGIIETVVTIYRLFYGKNYTIEKMGSIYCPEGTSEWINDVSYFYNEINNNPNNYFTETKNKEY